MYIELHNMEFLNIVPFSVISGEKICCPEKKKNLRYLQINLLVKRMSQQILYYYGLLPWIFVHSSFHIFNVNKLYHCC